MSSSDPTSNFDSLNVSSDSMGIPAAVGEASSQRSTRKCVSSKVQLKCVSTPRRARSKSLQGQGQGRRNMSQVINNMPKAHDSGRHSAVVSTGHGVGSESQPSQLPSDFPSRIPVDPRLVFTTPSNIMISDPSKSMLE